MPLLRRYLPKVLAILTLSVLCGVALWSQKIWPQNVQLGRRSATTLLAVERATVVDEVATARKAALVERKALRDYFEEPRLYRNNRADELSSLKLVRWQNIFEEWFRLRAELLSNGVSPPGVDASLLADVVSAANADYKKLWLTDLNLRECSVGSILRHRPTIFASSEFAFVLNTKSQKLRDGLYALNHEDAERLSALIGDPLWPELTELDWRSLEVNLEEALSLLTEVGGLVSPDERAMRALFDNFYDRRSFARPDLAYKLFQQIVTLAYVPNMYIKPSDMVSATRLALGNMEPVFMSVPEKVVIVSKGEVVDREKYSLIKQLRLDATVLHRDMFWEALGFTLAVFLVFGAYLLVVERYRLDWQRFAVLSCVMLSCAGFAGAYAHNNSPLLPVVLIAVTVGLFCRPSIGFAAGLMFMMLCLKSFNLPMVMVIPHLAGVLIGIASAQRAGNRAELARAGLGIGLAQSLVYVIVAFISRELHLRWDVAGLFALNGIFSAVLVSGVMPYLEGWFGVITPFRLRELSDLSQPLLKKLHDEAPGSYEHTLIVADLAQDAARRIGADADLVRVGVLYHDIGKTYNPQIFIENQFGGFNPHSDMTPLESAQAIIAHVTEGLRIANAEGLPAAVKAFIPTHQGTACAGHFFNKAKLMNPNLVDDKPYRYPGPRPFSRETGVVMLADTVEATIRSLRTDDKDLVRKTIDRLIDLRWNDGQLLDSKLTEADRREIAESFFQSWKNKNHERIKYITDVTPKRERMVEFFPL